MPGGSPPSQLRASHHHIWHIRGWPSSCICGGIHAMVCACCGEQIGLCALGIGDPVYAGVGVGFGKGIGTGLCARVWLVRFPVLS